MFTRPSSFSVLYGIQRTFLSVLYMISVLALFWLLFFLLHDIIGANGVVIVLSSILYLVLVVILYGFIHVIMYIPANLAGAFDPLKNDIARRQISSSQDLADRLAEFMTSFFNFAFFDIECTIVRIRDQDSSHPRGYIRRQDNPVLDELENISRETLDTSYCGKIRSDRGALHLYLTPLVFGEEWLGYIAVMSRRRLGKVFRNLLTEFENDFVDDQVIHVLGTGQAARG